jgi:hypothetical protein
MQPFSSRQERASWPRPIIHDLPCAGPDVDHLPGRFAAMTSLDNRHLKRSLRTCKYLAVKLYAGHRQPVFNKDAEFKSLEPLSIRTLPAMNIAHPSNDPARYLAAGPLMSCP